MDNNPLFKHGGFHPNFQEEKNFFLECKVYSIQIEANLACRQGCIYCYASHDDTPATELPHDDIISIINTAVKMGIKAIDWLGGDPLLRQDWYDLMKYAQASGLINNIWTSGIPLAKKDTAKKAVEVTKGGFISVHLDTLNEDIYQKLHIGNPQKKIKAILNGVDNVQYYGKNPDHMINCITFTKLVADDVSCTIRFFFKEKGMRTCLTQMCMTGLAADRKDLVPSPEEIQHACEARDRINYPSSPLSISTMDTTKFYCGGIICITIEGNVTPCSVIREGVGNIHETPFETIIEKHKPELLFTHLREKKNLPSDCRQCENNSICWGCRATAYYTYGDATANDPKCYKHKIK